LNRHASGNFSCVHEPPGNPVRAGIGFALAAALFVAAFVVDWEPAKIVVGFFWLGWLVFVGVPTFVTWIRWRFGRRP
jgi:hypothetical protein